MTLGTVLVILLIIFLLGGFSGRFGGNGYGLRVAIISAQARATAESGDGAPGIVAHPPFSTNVPRSQA